MIYHCANEPHEKCEQEVESDEKAKETPDVRHPSVLHCARDKILAQNDVRGARYAVLSLQAPLGIYRSAQQGFRGNSNLPLVLCHSTSGASDIRDDVGLKIITGQCSLLGPRARFHASHGSRPTIRYHVPQNIPIYRKSFSTHVRFHCTQRYANYIALIIYLSAAREALQFDWRYPN